MECLAAEAFKGLTASCHRVCVSARACWQSAPGEFARFRTIFTTVIPVIVVGIFCISFVFTYVVSAEHNDLGSQTDTALCVGKT